MLGLYSDRLLNRVILVVCKKGLIKNTKCKNMHGMICIHGLLNHVRLVLRNKGLSDRVTRLARVNTLRRGSPPTWG